MDELQKSSLKRVPESEPGITTITTSRTRENWEDTAKEYYDEEVFGFINDEPPEQLAWEKKRDRRHKLRPHVPSWLHRQKVPF